MVKLRGSNIEGKYGSKFLGMNTRDVGNATEQDSIGPSWDRSSPISSV